MEIGPSIDMARAKGYDMGIVLVLESPAHIKIFAEHPAHLRSVVICFVSFGVSNNL